MASDQGRPLSVRGILNRFRATARLLAAPLLRLNAWRVERHFRATLRDPALARSWANTYLRGLEAKPGIRVLDYGCGRGRVAGFLYQLGYEVVGVDVNASDWWRKMPDAKFIVVTPDHSRAPFRDAEFDIVLNIDSTHYYSPDRLKSHAEEVRRLLRPGGYWIVLQANPHAYGASLTQLRAPGQLHSLEDVLGMSSAEGFEEIDRRYEGLSSPVLSSLYLRLRHLVLPYPLYMYDQGSWLERLVPTRKRHRWVLRMRKIDAS